MDEQGAGGEGEGQAAIVAAVAISASPEFVRAPVMRRLLDFLVRETLAGRGDQLKAYAVAVDGLGRAADFDAQADSYPRVQVGRLRRMIDAYYASHGAADPVRLSIPQGRYRVVVEGQQRAPTPEPVQPATPTPTLPEPVAPTRRVRRPALVLGALLALMVAVSAAGLIGWRNWRGGDSGGLSIAPALMLDPPGGPRALAPLVADVDAVLVDGLRRSWLIRVQTPQGTPADDTASDYRLDGEVTGTHPPRLRLRLFSRRADKLVWTGDVALLPGVSTSDALAPVIAELTQAYGVIATDQRAAAAAGPVAPGYRCMLKVDQYRRAHGAALLAAARDCVARTIAIDDHHAPALAAAAMFALDKPGQADAVAKAQSFARRAVAADPYNPFAQRMLAQAMQAAGDCPATLHHARRAAELDPFEPDTLAAAGALRFACGDEGAEAMLARAIALDPNPPGAFYAPLVLAAVQAGKGVEAVRLAEQMRPTVGGAPGYDDMIRAIAFAAAGDAAKARAAMTRAGQGDDRATSDPDALLRRGMMPPPARQAALAALARAGIAPKGR